MIGPNDTRACFVTTVAGPSTGVATKRAHGVATRAFLLNKDKQVVVDLARAISYMTECGIIHRSKLRLISNPLTVFVSLTFKDLRPGNVLSSLSEEIDMSRSEGIHADNGAPRTITITRGSYGSLSANIPRHVVQRSRRILMVALSHATSKCPTLAMHS